MPAESEFSGVRRALHLLQTSCLLGVIKIVAVGVRVLGRAFSGCVGLPGPPKGHKPVPILEPPRLADAKNKFN